VGTRPTGPPGYVPSKPSATNSCKVRLFPNGVERDHVFEGPEGNAGLVVRKLRWGHAGLLRLGRSVLGLARVAGNGRFKVGNALLSGLELALQADHADGRD
jgi:hypothetical protein